MGDFHKAGDGVVPLVGPSIAQLLSRPVGDFRKESAGGVQGLEQRLLPAGSVGAQVPFPQVLGQQMFQVPAGLPRIDGKALLGACQPAEHQPQHGPCALLQHMLGIGQLPPPQPLGHIGSRPPKFVAALLKHLGAGALYAVGTLVRRRQGWQESVLVQQHYTEPVVPAVGGVVLNPGNGQVNAVAVGKLHQITGHVGEVLVKELVFVSALQHQHLPEGGGDVPFLVGGHICDQVHNVKVPEAVRRCRRIGPGAVEKHPADAGILLGEC